MTNLELLKAAIKSSGASITFLADKCAITRTSLYSKLEGISEFKLSEIIAICDALKLTTVERDTIFFND